MGKHSRSKAPDTESQLTTEEEVAKTTGVKRRKRNRNVKNQEKAPDETNTGNRLEVSFLDQEEVTDADGVTGAETRNKVLPGALAPPLDKAVPPTSDDNNDKSISKGDWKQLCRIWNKLSSRNKGSTAWTSPTPIQLQTWPILLSSSASPGTSTNTRNNLIMLAPTGSGKTLAYGIPLVLAAIRSVNEDTTARKGLAGLVLVPTRELALQVAAEVTSAAKAVSKKHAHQAVVVSCHGGVDKQQQVDAMLQVKASDGLIVTATPGRLLDLLQPTASASSNPNSNSDASLVTANANADKLRLRFSCVEYTVLDEADRLAVSADLYQQIDAILALCTERRVTCLVSATWPDKVQEKWKEWLGPGPCAVVKVNAMTLTKDTRTAATTSTVSSSTTAANETMPVNEDEANKDEAVPVASQDEPSSRANDWLAKIPTHLTQTLHVCSEHKKPRKLVITLEKMRKENTEYTRQQQLGIIFFAKIKTLQYMYKLLTKDGFACQELHSQLPQFVREQSVRRFQCGQVPLLLATDIAARGIHVNNIHFVINYDFPGNLEQYVHRCGRAGRGVGAETAHVFSFFTRNMSPMAADVVRLLEANQQWVDPNLRALAEPAGVSKSKRRRKENKEKESLLLENEDTKGPVNDDANPEDYNDAGSDEEGYLDCQTGLAPLGKRIVLKRADNVSDASSDDSDDDE
jgi:ATP-dependent RNA helicase DDX5/DBP2